MGQPDDFVSKFLDQVAVIWSAPRPFFLALAVLGGAIWLALIWRYEGVIANRDSEIKLVTAQRDDYQAKLGGATPDQAKAKIEALERTVHLVVGSKWEPLTKDETELLASNLSKIPPKFLNVFYENELGKDLAQTIMEAFRRAKWPEVFLNHGAGLGDGFAVGSGGGTALKIKSAIDSSTKLRPSLQFPNDTDDTYSSFFIMIGTNHN
jgi:hypothetical protein